MRSTESVEDIIALLIPESVELWIEFPICHCIPLNTEIPIPNLQRQNVKTKY